MAEIGAKPTDGSQEFNLDAAIQAILEKKSGQLQLPQWLDMLGVKGANLEERRQKAMELLAEMDDAKAYELMRRIFFTDFQKMSVQILEVRKRVRAGKAETAGQASSEKSFLTPSQEKLFGIAGITAATGTAIAASEVARRFDLLMKGDEQTYRANISISELKQTLEDKLREKDITVDHDFGRERGAGEGLVLRSAEGQKLLTIVIKNSQTDAPLNKTLFSDRGPRQMPQVEVTISESNRDNLAQKGLDILGTGARIAERIKRGDEATVGGMILGGIGQLTEGLGLLNLPNEVSKIIEELAEREENEFDEQSAEIAKQNNAQLELVLSALVCTSCGTARPKEASSLCESCGAKLSSRVEADVPKYEQQLVRFKQMGMISADS